jgi:hypothetical protein
MAREKCGLLAGPRTISVSWQSYPYPSLSVVSYYGNSAHASCYSYVAGLYQNAQSAMLPQCWDSCVMYSAWNPKDNYDMSASVFVVQFNGFMSLAS